MTRLTSDSPGLSIWLVEDDRHYRQTLVYLLNRIDGLHCDQVFFSLEELQRLLEGEQPWATPDVVLMDIGLPGRDGLAGVRYLKPVLPAVPIVMLTIRDTPEVIFEAFRAGASGYLLKDTPLDEVVSALHAAHRGGTLMPAAVAGKVLRFFAKGPPRSDYGLTRREVEVLQLMSEGLIQKQIAEALVISPHTVDNHIRHIYKKLHVRSAVAAVAKAVREGLL